MDAHERKRRYELVLALRRTKDGLDGFHEARVLVGQYSPELAELGSLYIRHLEDWEADVKALLEPH